MAAADSLQVFYASTGFRGEISGKVKDLNKPITSIPGNLSADQISDSVRWLLKDNNYIFGDLNVQVCRCLVLMLACN